MKVIIESEGKTTRTLFEGTQEQCECLFKDDFERGYYLDENDFEWDIWTAEEIRR